MVRAQRSPRRSLRSHNHLVVDAASQLTRILEDPAIKPPLDFLSAPVELAGREGVERLSPEQPDELRLQVLTDEAVAAIETEASNSTGEKAAEDSESKRVAGPKVAATPALALGPAERICSAPRAEPVATIESVPVIPVVPEFELVPEFGGVPNFNAVLTVSAIPESSTVLESSTVADKHAWKAPHVGPQQGVSSQPDIGQNTDVQIAAAALRPAKRVPRIAARAQDPEIPSESKICSALWSSGAIESVDAKGNPLTKVAQIGWRTLAASTDDMPLSVCQDGIRNLILKLSIERITQGDRGMQAGNRYRVFSFTEIIRRRREAGLLYYARLPGGGRIFVTIEGDEIDLVALSERRSAGLPKFGTNALPDLGEQGPDTGTAFVPNSGAQPVPNYAPLPIKGSLDKKTKPTTTSSVDVSRIVKVFLDEEPGADQFVIDTLINDVLSRIPDAQTEELESAIKVKGAETRQGRSVAKSKAKYLVKAVLSYFAGEAFQQRRLRAKAYKYQAELDRVRDAAASAIEAELRSNDHIWQQFRDRLSSKIDQHTFETWIKPLRFLRIQEGVMYVIIPIPEFKGVEDRHGQVIKETANELQLQVEKVQCVTAEEAVCLTVAGTDSVGGAL